MDIPEPIAAACAELFGAVPLDTAMPELRGGRPHHAELVERTLSHHALVDRPELAAGLWLYVDDLDRSHTICQGIDDATGSYWHSIMHRREGDISNSHHWARRAANHPLLQEHPEIDPDRLIDDAGAAGEANPPELVDRQRREWAMLFEWCCRQPQGG